VAYNTPITGAKSTMVLAWAARIFGSILLIPTLMAHVSGRPFPPWGSASILVCRPGVSVLTDSQELLTVFLMQAPLHDRQDGCNVSLQASHRTKHPPTMQMA
jgi:hypothetical protein